MPVKIDCPVVSCGEWHSEQPMLANRLAPFCVDEVEGPGEGGAVNRLKAAKFAVSDDISEAVPTVVPKFELLELPFKRFVESSGELLNTQPATALRSFGKSSFETPCSTL